MSLSDCEKCWNTPCTCGWDYKDMPSKSLSEFIVKITQRRPKEEARSIIQQAKEILDSSDGTWDSEEYIEFKPKVDRLKELVEKSRIENEENRHRMINTLDIDDIEPFENKCYLELINEILKMTK